MNSHYYRGGRYLVLDFETTSLAKGSPLVPENRLLLACGLDWTGQRMHCFGGEMEQSGLLRRLESVDFLVAHNAKFELGWLRRCGADLYKLRVFDTQIAQKVLAANRPWPLSLEVVAAHYQLPGKSPFVKGLIHAGIDPSTISRRALLAYCANDVALTAQIFHKQLALMDDAQLALLQTRCELTPVLADIERHGLRVDKELITQERIALLRQLGQLTQRLTELAPGVLLTSAKQTAAFLYDVLKVPELCGPRGFPLRTPGGARAVDMGTLGKLQPPSREAKEFIDLRLAHSKVNAALVKYITKLDNVAQGTARVFAQFNQTTTKTDRLSSTGLPPANIQFQNMDRDYKRLFVPSPGFLYLEADAGQLEFRVAVDMAQDKNGLAAIQAKRDVHQDTAKVIAGKAWATMSDEARRKLRAEIKPHCVPLDAEILTSDGWKTCHEVTPGAAVYTYNQAKDCLELQPLLEKVFFDDAECVVLGGAYWKTICTPNHRWYGTKRVDHGKYRSYDPCIVETAALTTGHTITTAASHYSAIGLPIADSEAAILGWLWGDGTVRISPLTKRAAQGNDGRRRLHCGVIIQKKYVAEIRALLHGVPHTETGPDARGIYRFALHSAWLRDLYARGVLASKQATVLAMSYSQRAAWFTAVLHAEGTRREHGEWRVAQNVGDMCEAIRLAALLLGFDTRIHLTKKETTHRATADHAQVTIRTRRYITGQRLSVRPASRQPVWCPRTVNGTWVMRQHKVITITGNTFKPLYGGMSGTTREKAYYKWFQEQYAGIYSMQQGWVGEAIREKRIRLPWGARYYFPDAMPDADGYVPCQSQVFNYPIQALATAEIVPLIVRGIWRDMQGLKSRLVNTVHDSVLIETAPDELEIVKKIVVDNFTQKVYTVLSERYQYRLTVPLSVEIKIGDHWGEGESATFTRAT